MNLFLLKKWTRSKIKAYYIYKLLSKKCKLARNLMICIQMQNQMRNFQLIEIKNEYNLWHDNMWLLQQNFKLFFAEYNSYPPN